MEEYGNRLGSTLQKSPSGGSSRRGKSARATIREMIRLYDERVAIVRASPMSGAPEWLTSREFLGVFFKKASRPEIDNYFNGLDSLLWLHDRHRRKLSRLDILYREGYVPVRYAPQRFRTEYNIGDPGREIRNYRELVFTVELPGIERNQPLIYEAWLDRKRRRGEPINRPIEELRDEYFAYRNEALNQIELAASHGHEPYQGVHFQSAETVLANVLMGDIRFGKKTSLHVGETQSDLHARAQAVERYQKIPGKKFRGPELVMSTWTGGPPDAPFKETGSSPWYGYVMKRMLRIAAQKKYDYLTWSTKEGPLHSYGTDLISWMKIPESEQIGGGWSVATKRQVGGEWGNINVEQAAERHLALQGQSNVNRYGVRSREHLFEAVRELLYSTTQGTEAVRMQRINRITDDIWKHITSKDAPESGQYAPRAEGMAAFYDRKLVNWMNNYLKKFEVRVEQVKTPGGLLVNRVPITPKMRESFLYEGQKWASYIPLLPLAAAAIPKEEKSQ